MPQGTLVKVKGVVIELNGTKTGTKNGRDWKKYAFTVKQLTGQLAKCNTFGKFDKDLIGETVEFDAEYNAKFSNYGVKGEIEVVESEESSQEVDAGPTEHEPRIPTPKKRGRKPKVKPAVVVQERTVESDLESVREAASLVFKRDLEAVHELLTIHSKDISSQALAVGVQGYQAIRATLFIEANKRERVTAMHGR